MLACKNTRACSSMRFPNSNGESRRVEGDEGACSSAWLEHYSDKVGVHGSNPCRLIDPSNGYQNLRFR